MSNMIFQYKKQMELAGGVLGTPLKSSLQIKILGAMAKHFLKQS